MTGAPLPDETKQAGVTVMQQKRTIPATGTVVPVDIADAGSHFKHRTELVYLPPAGVPAIPRGP